jgi:transposase-like protein
MDKQQRPKFSPEMRERAVRLAIEHRGDHASQWAAIVSIAAKIGCTAQTLVRQRARPSQRSRRAIRCGFRCNAGTVSSARRTSIR